MADADIYRLFMGAPDAAAQSQAMAEALRRRRESASLARNAGNVALLSGDRVLSNFGQAQLRQAGEDMGEAGRMEGMLAQAGSQGAGRALQEALAARQQEFQGEENRLNRALRARELGESAAARREDRIAREQARQDARDAAQGKVDEKAVQDLATRISDAGPLLRNIQELEKFAAPDEEGEERDIPGVGRLASRLPAELLSNEGADVQQRAYGVVSALLKLQSGAGVSEGEVQRKMKELGMGPGQSEGAFRIGLKRLGGEYRSSVKEALRRHDPRVVETYLSRGNVIPGGINFKGGQVVEEPTVVEEKQLEDGRVIQRLSDGSKRLKGG